MEEYRVKGWVIEGVMGGMEDGRFMGKGMKGGGVKWGEVGGGMS